MILQVSANLFVEPDGRTWIIRGTGGPVYGLSNLRGVADALVARHLLPAAYAQRHPAVLARANELSPALREQLAAGRSITFAAGGFTISRGNGDFLLANPTQEVARLPHDRDSRNRKVVVGYYASPGDALVLAVERSIQACSSTLPYLSLNETAFAIASRLWADLATTQPSTDGGRTDRIGIRLEGAPGRVDRGNSDDEHVTWPPGQGDTVSRITHCGA